MNIPRGDPSPLNGATGSLRGFSAKVRNALRRGILCYNMNNKLIMEAELILLEGKASNLNELSKEKRDRQSPREDSNLSDKGKIPAEVKPGRGVVGRSFDGGPFPKIPNVAKFKITTSGYDELIQMFNLEKRLPAKFQYEPYNNGPLIRYAMRVIVYLRKLIGASLYMRYGAMVLRLMERSTTFQLMAIYKCFPRFHRDLSLGTVYKMLEEMSEIVRCRKGKIEYRRVYIPKDDAMSKWRPLGVPSPVWRCVLSLLTFFIVTAFDPLLPEWQHAYRPGKGTLSAGDEILRNVPKAKFVGEFDIKGFFDNVRVDKVIKNMDGLLSPEMRECLLYMASIAPKLPAETKIDEIAAQTKIDLERARQYGYMFFNGYYSYGLGSIDEKTGLWTTGGYIGQKGGNYLTTPSSEIKGEVMKGRRIDNAESLRYKGFPQGAAMSAFLSVLYLRDIKLPKGANLVMYADDGLIYSDEPFNWVEFQDELKALSLDLNMSKCRGVKRHGDWLHDLKFLGLILTREAAELRSETRAMPGKPSVSHVFDQQELVKARKIQSLGYPEWMAYVLSRLKGDGKSTLYLATVGLSQTKMVRETLRLVLGHEQTRNFQPSSKMLRVSIIETRDRIKDYFLQLLQGRVGYWGQASNQPGVSANLLGTRLVEESLLQLYRAKAGPERLRGRLSYLVRYKALPLGQQVEQAITSGVTGEDTLNSRLMGGFQSKMYWEGFTNTKVMQDFQLTWKAGTSGLALRSKGQFKYERYHKGKLLDFANSTSIAFYDISQMYKVRRLCGTYMKWYKNNVITLEELNNLRAKVGRPPVRSTYIRHLQINPLEFYSGRAIETTQLYSDPIEGNVQNLHDKGYPPIKVRGRPYGGVNPPDHLAGHPGGPNRPNTGRGVDKSPRKKRRSRPTGSVSI